MPAFQRKPEPGAKFYCKGMNLNRPLDQLEEGEFAYLLNMRPYQDAQLNVRPGLQLQSDIFATMGSATYLHSLLRLNDSSANPDAAFRWCRYVGDDRGKLWFGQGNPAITDPSYSEFQEVPFLDLSGNPLSLIAIRPWSAPSPAVYIGDYFAIAGVPQQMKSVFFRPGDSLATGPRLYLMGVPPPNDAVTPTAGGAGNLIGTYWWRFVARNTYTGARSNPSNPTRQDAKPDPTFGGSGLSTGLLLDGATNGQGTMTLPNMPSQTMNPTDFVIDVYRFGGTVFDWHYVGTDDPGASFTDNLGDVQVLSAITLPVDSAGTFALVQPFPSADIAHAGTGTLNQSGSDQPNILTPDNPSDVNPGWPPGTTVIIRGQSATLFRFPEPGTGNMELLEDVLGITGISSGSAVPWSVPVGATIVASPVQHMWGPYGSGVSGLYLFGCGDPNQAGTLYWTNGNDPDSAALTNTLDVTDPSEPLINGMIFDTRNYVWSSKRMFEIIPDPSTPGNFLARQIPNAGGLYAPWGICDCGAFLAYIGYDGIYISQGVGAESFTDVQLYPWFPHEATPGQAFLRGGDFLTVADPHFLQLWRLSWQDGILYFDWPPVTDT